MKKIIHILVFTLTILSSSTQNGHFSDSNLLDPYLDDGYYEEGSSRSFMEETFLNPFNWMELVRNINNIKHEVRQLTKAVEENKRKVEGMARSDLDVIAKQGEEVTARNTTTDSVNANIKNLYHHIKAIRAKLKKKGGKKKLERTKKKARKVNQDVMTVNKTVETVNMTYHEFVPTVNVSAIQAVIAIVNNSDTANMLVKLTEKLTALETKVTELETQNTALKTDVASLKTDKCDATKCTEIETKTTTLETTTATIKSDVETVETDVGTLKTDVAALKTSKCDATTCTTIETDLTPVKACMATPTDSSCADNAKYGVATGLAKLVTIPPSFNCVFKAASDADPKGFATSGATIAPYTCAITTSGMVDSTGVFTVAVAGYYRFTFMARMKGNTKKIVLEIHKNDDSDDATHDDEIARGVAQAKTIDFEITGNLNVIAKLVVGDKINTKLSLPGSTANPNTGFLQADHDDGPQLIFTGQFIKPAD